MHRVKIRYAGRVQGVGFRATVFDLSRGYDVVGQVRNMSDGSVELLAEGQETTLSELHMAILKRMGRNIVSHDASWLPISETSFDRFTIAPTSPN